MTSPDIISEMGIMVLSLSVCLVLIISSLEQRLLLHTVHMNLAQWQPALNRGYCTTNSDILTVGLGVAWRPPWLTVEHLSKEAEIYGVASVFCPGTGWSKLCFSKRFVCK